MILMAVVSMGLMFGMPKLMENSKFYDACELHLGLTFM